MICKELEEFVSLELDWTEVAELVSLLLDDEALLWFLANELLVNKANVSGSVNPVIESDEASSSERTLFAALWVLGAAVVTNDSASVIDSVEPTIGKLEDWRMVRMLVLLRSEVGVVVLVLLTEMRWLE